MYQETHSETARHSTAELGLHRETGEVKAAIVAEVTLTNTAPVETGALLLGTVVVTVLGARVAGISAPPLYPMSAGYTTRRGQGQNIPTHGGGPWPWRPGKRE